MAKTRFVVGAVAGGSCAGDGDRRLFGVSGGALDSETGTLDVEVDARDVEDDARDVEDGTFGAEILSLKSEGAGVSFVGIIGPNGGAFRF